MSSLAYLRRGGPSPCGGRLHQAVGRSHGSMLTSPNVLILSADGNPDGKKGKKCMDQMPSLSDHNPNNATLEKLELLSPTSAKNEELTGELFL